MPMATPSICRKFKRDVVQGKNKFSQEDESVGGVELAVSFVTVKWRALGPCGWGVERLAVHSKGEAMWAGNQKL